jgi:hypothetical protein
LLEKSAPKRKAGSIDLEISEDVDKRSDVTSLRCEEELNLEDNFMFGSKKRM